MTNNWQRGWRIACAGLAFGLVVLLQLLQPASVVRFDEGLRDTFVRLHARDTPEDRLVIVDIDEHAIQEIGAWPWSRGKVADLIEALMIDYEARKIALDIVFPKRGDDTGDQRLALLLEHLPVIKAQVLDYTPDRTDTLAEGLLSSGQPNQAGAGTGQPTTYPRLAISATTPLSRAPRARAT